MAVWKFSRDRDSGRLEKDLLSAIHNLEKKIDTINKRLTAVEAAVGRRGAETHFYHIHNALTSLVRRQYLDPNGLEYPDRLLAQRFRLYSQNYEDGITKAIFDEVGVESRRAVEIGCGSNGGNSGFLVAELGWRALLLDADQQKLAMLRASLAPARAEIVEAWVTAETCNDLLEKHGFAGDIDFLSIDLDGIDYWVWKELSVASPRLVVLEYNSAFGCDRSVTVPYSQEFSRKGHRLYFGASLQALVRLGQVKGYRLVCVEPRGVNAFFLRNDVGPAIPECPAEQAFRMLEKHRLALARTGTDLFSDLESKKLPLVEV